MPKLTCNGFSMFAQHVRLRLETELGRKFSGMDEQLIQAATPLWDQLTLDEKNMWKKRAKSYKRTDEFLERKRAVRARKSPVAKNRKAKDDQAQYYPDSWDFPDDADLGVPIAPQPHPPPTDGNSGVEEKGLPEKAKSSSQWQQKRIEDKRKLTDFLVNASGGTLDDVKRCRFLFLSMQTYGKLAADLCVPAELAICEFNLKYGVVDDYQAIMGPWNLGWNLSQRAEFNARSTHQIALSGCETDVPEYTSSVVQVLKEVLGRTEPGIARNQGVAVGLYKDGIFEFDSDTEEKCAVEEDDWTAQEPNAVQRKRKTKGSSRFPPLPGDLSGRRWLICIEEELESLMMATKHLMESEQMDYEGFPITPDRYIFLDTLVEVLSQFVGARPEPNYMAMLCALAEPFQPELETPWDRQAQMFCSFHRPSLNRFCACATARRACFTLFRALRDAYNLPFEH